MRRRGLVPGDLTGQQLAFLAILAVAFALLLTERLRNDVVAVLLVRTSPEQLAAFRAEPGLELHPVEQYDPRARDELGGAEAAERFVQAVVAPGADLVGRTIAEIDFRRRWGAIVVSLWRQRGWLDQELA